MSKSQTRWIVPDLGDLPKELEGYDFILAQLLLQRGIVDRDAAEKFLNPSLKNLGDPFLLDGMTAAVERIKQAAKSQEKVTIYGDYDVDGVASATVLRGALAELGIVAEVYLPERMKEGYGLNNEAVTKLAEAGTQLLITVDTGTTAVAEIALATKLGMDVIVVDHHHVPEEMPVCVAVINPHKSGQDYPFSDLAAVGVTYRLAYALLGEVANQWLDLVAVGTVADVVPLVGENRTITVFGLEILNRTQNLGLQALIEVAGLLEKRLEVYHIGFQIGPRLNAAGRMDHAITAYQLLNADNAQEAKGWAQELNSLNTRRQEMTDSILQASHTRALEWEKEKIVIVENEGWSVGVVGIVAGRLVEKYAKPAIVFDKQESVYKGSARSVDGVHIVELLDMVKHRLAAYGGHAKAAGMSVAIGQYADFKTELLAAAQSIDDALLTPAIAVSLVVDIAVVTDQLLATVEQMAPFGFGNPTPTFGVEGVSLVDIDTQGFGSTMIKMTFADSAGHKLTIVGFDKTGELLLKLTRGQSYNVAFTISINDWKGRKYRQQKLVDLAIV